MRLNRIEGILVGAAIGLITGLGMYTFIYAKGGSYLTNDPAAYANCHIMQSQYDGWVKSSHRSVAGCNDCHTPAGFVAKYASKASNGFWHSFAFTTGRFHEPIEIKAHNREITEQSCRKCHQEVVESIESAHAPKGDTRLSCIRCHSSVGHQH
jgi:cytochrome c nitrite reductase small subunit